MRGSVGERSSYGLCVRITSCSRNRGENGLASSVGSSLPGMNPHEESISCSLSSMGRNLHPCDTMHLLSSFF